MGFLSIYGACSIIGILADRNKRNIMAGLDFLASFRVLLAALFMREGNSLAIICYWEAWSIQLLD